MLFCHRELLQVQYLTRLNDLPSAGGSEIETFERSEAYMLDFRQGQLTLFASKMSIPATETL